MSLLQLLVDFLLGVVLGLLGGLFGIGGGLIAIPALGVLFAVEQQMAQEILARCQHKPVNLIGQTSLKQLMALIKQVQLVVATDTGPTHMATAAGVPVIGLYAHHNPERTGPYRCREQVVSVYAQLIEAEQGKPVAQLPWRSRLKDPVAMAYITPAMVISRFDQLCHQLALCKEPA